MTRPVGSQGAILQFNAWCADALWVVAYLRMIVERGLRRAAWTMVAAVL